jgi:DNA polymerase V
VATDSVIEIVDKAIQMIRSRFRNGFQYKKAGVILYGISMKNAVQYNLFDTIDRSRQNKLTTALDSINSQYGKGTIKLAVEGDFANSNAVKSEHRSPRYSTKWDEIPQINCKK